MEYRSKFACLNIDDDSDEEFTRVSNNKAASKKGAQNGNGGPDMKNGGKLVVHAVEKRPKAKKGNKEKVVDPTTGLIVQGVDEKYAAEQKYREDLKQALRESTHTTAKSKAPSSSEKEVSIPSKAEEHTPSMVDKVLAAIDEESRKQGIKSSPNSEKDAHPLVIALYRSKLTEMIEETLKANEKVQAAQTEVEKYRTKYRKLVELFRDTEVTEKAKLVMDLEKARSTEAELASQLAVMQRELEQCKSKLRALGALR
ncbi:hypothetical protein GCK32_000365 [Trichostrongylus colubriformis]|uniref:Uncharacterized protein n=1 Tax=Trichostrongylus colubriformis TaxID=6319 RepID=A0AAN8G5J1_TRICO